MSVPLTPPGSLMPRETIDRMLREHVEAMLARRIDPSQSDLAKLPDFRGANLEEVNFGYALLEHARFEEAYLPYADFYEATLNRARFKEANLTNARFIGALLVGARFDRALATNARLQNATLTWARLDDAQFTGAVLDNARMRRTNCDATNFDGASMPGVDLSDSDLTGASFVGTILDGAIFDGAKNAPENASVQWKGHGEIGRRMSAYRHSDGTVRYTCGCVMGYPYEQMKEWIEWRGPDFRKSRMEALDTVARLMGDR